MKMNGKEEKRGIYALAAWMEWENTVLALKCRRKKGGGVFVLITY